MQLTDGSLTLEYPFNMAIVLDSVTHSSISSDHQMQIRRRIVLPDGLAHRVEWRYYLRRSSELRARKGKAVERVGRKLRVGGSSILSRHDNPAVLQHGLVTFDGKRLLVGGLNAQFTCY